MLPLTFAVIDVSRFKKFRLLGGFVIQEVEITSAPIVDAIGREAVAQTTVTARDFRLLIRSGLSEDELSITLYHEILEAASIAVTDPPDSVVDFNEAGFERAAQEAHERWGKATPASLNLLLQFYGF